MAQLCLWILAEVQEHVCITAAPLSVESMLQNHPLWDECGTMSRYQGHAAGWLE